MRIGILAHCFAFGKPTVASNSESMREKLSKTDTGLVFKDSSDCVEKIVKILSDKELSTKLGQNAKAYVQNEISWSKIARLYLNTYQEVIEMPKIKSHVVTID